MDISVTEVSDGLAVTAEALVVAIMVGVEVVVVAKEFRVKLDHKKIIITLFMTL